MSAVYGDDEMPGEMGGVRVIGAWVAPQTTMWRYPVFDDGLLPVALCDVNAGHRVHVAGDEIRGVWTFWRFCEVCESELDGGPSTGGAATVVR